MDIKEIKHVNGWVEQQLDTAREFINWKMDLRKLSKMHKDIKIWKYERLRDMEDGRRRSNIYLIPKVENRENRTEAIYKKIMASVFP